MAEPSGLQLRLREWATFQYWQKMTASPNKGQRAIAAVVLTILLCVREFGQDRCSLRASALTFYTLLSIVPLAAMAFGIAQGFGFERHLEARLFEQLAGQEQVVQQVIDFARALLENTKGGMLAGIGVIILFWSTIKVLNHIEFSFNDIWRVKTPRKWVRKFSDYLSIILVSPVLILISGSATVFIATQISMLADRWNLSSWSEPLIFFVIKSSPYVSIWILFTLVYLIMPNTRIAWRPALVAGILAGTCYHILQWGYISFQIGAARLNAIYGSFAALPLFLIWLELSWIIVLFGAEVAYVLENYRDLTALNGRFGDLSNYRQRIINLAICRYVTTCFVDGKDAPNTAGIALHLHLPHRLVRRALGRLTKAQVLVATATSAYVPACNPDQITLGWVSRQLDRVGSRWQMPSTPNDLKEIQVQVDKLTSEIAKASANQRLAAL